MFCFGEEIFFGQIWSKKLKWNFHNMKMKVGTKTNLNILNSIVMLICPVLNGKHPFRARFLKKKKKKLKLYGPFLWMGFNYIKATATWRRQFTFYHSVPRNSWYAFYRSRKDERLSQPWSPQWFWTRNPWIGSPAP